MNAIVKSLLSVVGGPTFLAVLYFGFFASDVYVSESRFSIQSAQSTGSASGLEALVNVPIVSTGSKEVMIVTDFVESQDMMRKIQEELDIREHYSADSIDLISRLSEDASQEEMLEYFRDHVNMIRDSQSDVITLTTRAYNPEMAQDIARAIIELSENLVNTLSKRMEDDALMTARDEVARAEEMVRAASASVTAFRRSSSSLNPAAESSALLGIVSGLEAKLTETRSLLSEKRAYMREDSFEVETLKNRIKAISNQLSLERGRLSGGEDDHEMGGLIEAYQPLILDQELAQQLYASALSSMELARLEAQRQKQYLVTFIHPNLPDDAIEPYRINRIITVIVFSFLVYIVLGLMWSALKDHIGK